MNIDPNYAICVYRDNPRPIVDYIVSSLGFDVFVYGLDHDFSVFLLDNNKNSLIELCYCRRNFYVWTNDETRFLEDKYCVNYVPVSNIINRFLHVYRNYHQQLKIDHQQDIRQAGLVYDV